MIVHRLTSALPDRRGTLRLLRLSLLVFIAAGLMLGVFLLTSGQQVERLSMATAYASLILLALALSIGPWNVLRAAPNPLSTYLRRDIGIIAAILTVAHTIFGLQVHMGGDFLRYFLDRTPGGGIGVRLDAFGFANHFGLIAVLIMLLLLGISNDASIRRLGPQWWKRVQRWNYVGAMLVILHGFVYQALEHRKLAFILCVLIVASVAFVLQVLGFWLRRRRPT